MIGPIRVFVLKRIGTQKVQFGVRAPRGFLIVRGDGRSPDSKQFEVQVKNTEPKASASSESQQWREVDTLEETDSAHEESELLVQENATQQHGKSSETAPLALVPATNLEMQRLLSRNLSRLR